MRRRIWLGIGVSLTVPLGIAASAGTAEPTVADAATLRPPTEPLREARADAAEGGELGEGGETGIDPERARHDALAFLSALAVIEAHYAAGLAAYEAGLQGAAAQLFAHPIAEILVDLEPVLAERGVPDLGPAMERAATLAGRGAAIDAVRAAAEEVRSTLEEAARRAPETSLSATALQARLVAELLQRTARQYYRFDRVQPDLEGWLDALGFFRVAKARAERAAAAIAAGDPELDAAIRRAIARIEPAFLGVEPPSERLPVALLLAEARRVERAAARLP